MLSLVGAPGEGEISGLSRALVVLYFVEVGLALIIAPWTQFWDRNYFVEGRPMFEEFLTSPAIRGAVTGVGLVSLWAAVMETAVLLRRRWAQSPTTIAPILGPPPPPSSTSAQELGEEAIPPSS